jgi:site-specific DNA-methyltransferase (adenine-specific)
MEDLIVRVEVSSLTHHPLNDQVYVSHHNVDELVDSIKELGLLEMLVINHNNEVISGNRRLNAIKKLGWKEVDVKKVNVPKEDEVLFLINYNKQRVKLPSEMLQEYNMLQDYYVSKRGKGYRSDLLGGLKGNSRDITAKELGISTKTISKLIYIKKHLPIIIPHIDSGKFSISQAYLETKRRRDKKLAKQQPKDVKPLDEVITPKYRLYTKSSDKLEEVEDGSVNVIFTSPPYGGNVREYSEGIENDTLGKEDNIEDYVINLCNHLKDCKRVLSDDGSFLLNIGDKYVDGCQQLVPQRVALKLIDQGWILRNSYIWRKTNPKPTSAKDRTTNSYEYIFHFVKSKNYKYHKIGTPIKYKNNFSVPPNHISTDGYEGISITPYLPSEDGLKKIDDYLDDDVITTATENYTELKKYSLQYHPAPFPKTIVMLIAMVSDRGDVVLDPFNGSGTTGVVSLEFGRNYIGYDLNPNFISLTKERLEDTLKHIEKTINSEK